MAKITTKVRVEPEDTGVTLAPLSVVGQDAPVTKVAACNPGVTAVSAAVMVKAVIFLGVPALVSIVVALAAPD
jgi:hypothetical protein